MRKLILSGLVTAIALSFAPVATAQPSTLSQAISLCRTTVAEQAHVALENVRFDQARDRARAVRVDVDVWNSAGQLTNVRCDISKGDTLTVASITPPLQTATASN